MTTDTDTALSAECTLAKQPDYRDMHDWCRRTDNIPLPHSGGKILLVERCRCSCHRQTKPATQ